MTNTDSAPNVLLERDGAVAALTLNRPARLNAMTGDLLDELLGAVEGAVSDPAIRVVTITGAGRGFCAGGDMDGFARGDLVEDVPLSAQVGRLRQHMRIVQLLRDSDVVSVAGVNGACAGAGLSLALACDLRVASVTAVFRAAFLDAGLSGDFGGTWLLPRVVGTGRASWMYLLNERVSASDALSMGLVTGLYPADKLAEAVAAIAHQLAAKAPIALRSIKRNLIDSAYLDLATACDREADRHIRCGRTDDALEAARAFVEKREPTFLGK